MGREMVDSELGSSSASSSSFSQFGIFHNYPLISAVLAFAIAQTAKFIITWYKENRWDPKRLVGSGGMPSSHSSTVTALAMAVGFSEGFGSSFFAAAVILAAVVMYDAFGVRLHAGRQAEVLNQIVLELPTEHPLADRRPLRELLGHTPPEVFAGGILGAVVATVAHIINTVGGQT
jgi:acid phosphatase family membrane protein YuiD